MSAETFWNGEPADALRCKVLVPRHSWPLWLDVDASPLRHAVRVQQDGYKFFLDNEDGSGWAKVTNGRGSPYYGHRSLPVGCAVSSGDSDWNPSGDSLHGETVTPSWDTKLRCRCGFEAATKREMREHLDSQAPITPTSSEKS